MAGPVATVVLSKKISSKEKDLACKAIKSISKQTEGNDFWVQDTSFLGGVYRGKERPFFVSFGFEFEGEQEELALEFSGKPNFLPLDMIIFGAMCNSSEDHQILAQLCVYVAKQLDGVVGFGSSLQSYTSDQSLLSDPGRMTTKSSGDFFTPEFLKSWLSHADFRMVK